MATRSLTTWLNVNRPIRCLLALWCVCVGASAQAQTVEYIHTDALGSPIAVTDANQQVIERSEYAPYGDLLNRADANEPGYTGHVLDAATGMSYMQQRYYDPLLGRFLSVDPVSVRPMGDNFNRYWYAGNNPYKFTDPDGRDITCGGNRCTLEPVGGKLPTITFPRPEGFPAKISAQDSMFHHVYRFSDGAGQGDANYGLRVNNQLVQNPTPMENQPATLQGSKIDVNANNAISRITGQDNVMSYKIPLQGGANAVLNVTTSDHAAIWGIVLRTTEAGPDGTQNIITYGEGDSFLQRAFDPNNNQSRKVWAKSAEDITRKAQQP
ncbi:RHS repeat-associated core domain-containing protein [Pseudoxanthomonas winnipegensis]|uniref:RHS repeat-associated core domain-containing protein n=1 Tax=Pseudoxanthomonas winnipegensis TaxID=2480810 RepID=UPI0030F4435D